MSLLYKRQANVQLDQAGERSTFPCGPGGYRVSFQATVTYKSSPNELTAELYNLRPDARARFVEGASVSLTAGYKRLTGQIFGGTVIHAEDKRQGASIITTIDASDGRSAKTSSAAALSFKPGTSLVDQLKTLLGAVKGDQGFKAELKKKLERARGHGAFGLITDELDNLLKPQGLEWSFQGGVLQITESRKPTDEPAIVLGVKTGLVAARPLEKGRAKVFARLQPGLVPRRALALELDGLTGALPQPGRYVIDKGVFSGDTHGPVWQAELDVSPIEQG